MQQQPPLPAGAGPDLAGLPEPIRRAVAGVQRQAAEAAVSKPEPPPAPAGPPVPPRLDDRLLLEVEAVRRRRLREAFLGGVPAAPRGLWAGVAVAIGLALAIGLLALIQATMDQQSRAAHAPRAAVAQVTPSL